jgi:hypothetical protein
LGLIAGAISGYIPRERSGRAALRQALNQTPIDGSDRSASVFFAHRCGGRTVSSRLPRRLWPDRDIIAAA